MIVIGYFSPGIVRQIKINTVIIVRKKVYWSVDPNDILIYNICFASRQEKTQQETRDVFRKDLRTLWHETWGATTCGLQGRTATGGWETHNGWVQFPVNQNKYHQISS